MAVLSFSLTLPTKLHQHSLSYSSFSSFSTTTDNLSLFLSNLSLHRSNSQPTKPFTVRMGGGPRTYPGGVTKWQWKRMQKKKAKQLLKARLMRERQIYEMRKRAELKAAVSELERPWEVVEQAAPNLFSVGADEQLKVLADRFQKPGGFDLWTENDGPQLFETPDGLPTARFFPKGVVHSTKPYGRVYSDDDLGGVEDEIEDMGQTSRGRLKRGLNSGFVNGQESGELSTRSRKSMKQGRRDRNFGGRFSEAEDSDGESSDSSSSRVFSGVNRRQSGQWNRDKQRTGNQRDGDFRKNGNRRSVESGDAHRTMKLPDSRRSVSSARGRRNSSRAQNDGNSQFRRDSGLEKRRNSSYMEDVYDMSLQTDGSYSLDSS